MTTWFVVALIGLSLFAGAGAKWVADRVWPPYEPFDTALRLLVDYLVAQQQRPAARAYTADSTLDVLADGFMAGQRSRPGQGGGTSDLVTLAERHAGRGPSLDSLPAPPAGNGYREQGLWPS